MKTTMSDAFNKEEIVIVLSSFVCYLVCCCFRSRFLLTFYLVFVCCVIHKCVWVSFLHIHSH